MEAPRRISFLSLPLAAAVLTAIVLLVLTEEVWHSRTRSFDDAARRWVAAPLAGPAGERVAHGLSMVGSIDVLFVASLAIAAAWLLRREYAAATLLLVTMSGAFVLD